MTHEHGNKDRHQLDHHFVVDQPRADGSTVGPVISEDPEQLFKDIEKFAKYGRGSGRELPRRVSSLTTEYKIKVSDLLADLSKRISGDEVLEIGEIVHEPLDFRIEHALKARKPVSEDKLRRYLRTVDAAGIARLGENEPMLTKVRALLPGPFGVQLPQVAGFPDPLHDKPLLVKWYLATTDKTVAALTFSARGSGKLAETLDALGEWSWLDELHIGHSYVYGSGLERLRAGTKKDAVRDKIQKMLGSFVSADQNVAASEAGKKDLHDALDSNASMSTVLEAAGRAGYASEQDPEALKRRFAGESPASVLEFLFATSLSIELGSELLATAGATAEQAHAYLLSVWAEDRAKALTNSKTRKHIRRLLGALPLTSVFPDLNDREAAHAVLYKDAAVREWAYAEKSAVTNLWMAAGSSHAREACKLVRRETGLKWAHELTTTAPSVELRRFVLNCGDEKIAKYVREHVLGDRQTAIEPDWDQVETPDPEIYGIAASRGDRARLQVAEIGKDVPEEQVEKNILDRLADMTAADRTALLTVNYEIKNLITPLSGESLMRAVFLLGPTISQLLAFPLANEPSLLDYLRTRPASEEAAALGKPSLIKPARKLFPGISPLVVYATLADPHALAKALGNAPEFLTWLLEDTEPSLALACLARDEIRAVAAPLFESRAQIFERLPAYKHLLPAGKRGFDALAKAAEYDDSKDDAENYRQGNTEVAPEDSAVDKNAERMVAASSESHLWDAIDTLAKNHGNQKSALALVNNASAKERLALLGGGHTDSVMNLKSLIGLSPHHVFPTLTTPQLLSLPDAASWLLESEPSFAILDRIALDRNSVTHFARILDSNKAIAARWITGLPEGPSLTLKERHALDVMCEHVTDDATLRMMFKARYATEIDSTFPSEEAKRVWKVLARLPPSQVNQQTIGSFTHGNIGDAAGLWDHKNVVLAEDRSQNEGKDHSYNDAPLLSVDEVKKYFGLDDAQLAQASDKHGWIQNENGKYRVKPIDIEQFTSTVLHEVGHSVDQLLGEHTELIYGTGGWKRYGVDQFEQWAIDMGGLDGITGRDRKDIISAWKDAIRSGRPVSEMVDDKHPALAKRYDNDPLIAAARAGHRFYYKEAPRPIYNGRVFTTNGVVLSSVPKQTADVAPSQYAMSAPAEYFAECYVEYYRAYDGSPTTEKHKGGHLAEWIKQWFDKYVDKIRFSPQRLHGRAEKNEVGAQPTGD